MPARQVGIKSSTHPEFKIIILKKRERETNELSNKEKLYNSTCGLPLVSMRLEHTAEVLIVIREKKVALNTGSISSNTIHRVPNRKLTSAVLFKVALVLVQIFVKTAAIVPLFLLWSVFDP